MMNNIRVCGIQIIQLIILNRSGHINPTAMYYVYAYIQLDIFCFMKRLFHSKILSILHQTSSKHCKIQRYYNSETIKLASE